MQRMHRGIPDYGCCVNIAKSKVNFDVEAANASEAANTAKPMSTERGGERVGDEGGGSGGDGGNGGNGGENRWKNGGRNGGENGEGDRGGTRGNPAAMGQCPSVHQPYKPVLQPVPRYDWSDHVQDSGGERGETTTSDEWGDGGGGGGGGGESDGLPRCLPRRPPQPRLPKPLLDWCGLKFDADTGAFFANYGRYKGDNIRTSMTISSSSQHPGLDLKRRIARYKKRATLYFNARGIRFIVVTHIPLPPYT